MSCHQGGSLMLHLHVLMLEANMFLTPMGSVFMKSQGISDFLELSCLRANIHYDSSLLGNRIPCPFRDLPNLLVSESSWEIARYGGSQLGKAKFCPPEQRWKKGQQRPSTSLI